MKFLAIETSTEACSVALFNEGEIFEIHEIVPRQHTDKLIPMIDQILSEHQFQKSDLDYIAFSRGPGAFTGVRISCSAAQGIAYGLGVGVVPVSTLEILAIGAVRQFDINEDCNIISCIDARMGEVYWAGYSYKSNKLISSSEEYVVSPDDINISISSDNVFAIGSAWGVYEGRLKKSLNIKDVSIADDHYPHSKDLALLAALKIEQGKVVPPEEALPVYLRNNVATPKK